jgi:hypothetical protein
MIAIKVVVDEMPNTCSECKYRGQVDHGFYRGYYCIFDTEMVKMYLYHIQQVRLKSCPLVLESEE